MLAFTASDLILGIVLAAAGALFAYTVGHEIERDVTATGSALGKVGNALSNPILVVGVIIVAWLVLRARRG